VVTAVVLHLQNYYNRVVVKIQSEYNENTVAYIVKLNKYKSTFCVRTPDPEANYILCPNT
jgi:hypothetical protein